MKIKSYLGRWWWHFGHRTWLCRLFGHARDAIYLDADGMCRCAKCCHHICGGQINWRNLGLPASRGNGRYRYKCRHCPRTMECEVSHES